MRFWITLKPTNGAEPVFPETATIFCSQSQRKINPLLKGALSELCFPLLKGGNSTLIAAMASGLSKKQISVIPITTARMAQIERKWDLITKP